MNLIAKTMVITASVLACIAQSYADSYTYDDLNRLIAVTHSQTAQITHYEYDAGGNLLSVRMVDLPKYDIEVYIKDNQGNPLAGVTVSIPGQIAVSDEKGYLQLIGLLADHYQLIALKNGHNFTAQEIIVGENSENTVNIISDGLTQCQLYAVHDQNRSDTQFITLKPNESGTFDMKLLGSVYEGYDVEAMDAHPTTGHIIVAVGDDSITPGQLYLLNAQTGGLTAIGDTGFNEINGLSFTPDGVLWGAAETQGLIQINLVNAVGSLIIPYEGPVEDMTWDNEGKILYTIQHQTLVAYDSQDNHGKFTIDCPLPKGEIEALEMLPDNRLLLGMHDDKTFSIYALNIDSCEIEIGQINPSVDIAKPLDIEGITWPEVCF